MSPPTATSAMSATTSTFDLGAVRGGDRGRFQPQAARRPGCAFDRRICRWRRRGSVQHRRASARRVQQMIGDGEVVADQVELGRVGARGSTPCPVVRSVPHARRPPRCARRPWPLRPTLPRYGPCFSQDAPHNGLGALHGGSEPSWQRCAGEGAKGDTRHETAVPNSSRSAGARVRAACVSRSAANSTWLRPANSWRSCRSSTRAGWPN